MPRKAQATVAAAVVLALPAACLAGHQAVHFRKAARYAFPGEFPGTVAVTDINRDHRPDIVSVGAESGGAAGEPGPSHIHVLLGTGKGGFGPLHDSPAPLVAGAIRVVDLDGDHVPDVASANGTQITVYYGSRSGAYRDPREFPVGQDPQALGVFDVNRDGRPDLITPNATSKDVSVLLNAGARDFRRAATVPVGSAVTAVAIGDLNNDRRPDIVAAGGGLLSTMLGNGDGTFRRTRHYPIGEYVGIVQIIDMDRDGHADVLAASDRTDVVERRGDGSGRLGAANARRVRGFIDALAAARLDGDRYRDVIAGDDSAVVVLRGRPGGRLRVKRVMRHPSPTRTSFSDLNRDGRADALVAVVNESHLLIYLSGDGGHFAKPLVLHSERTFGPAQVADLDGDHRRDIISTNDDDLAFLGLTVFLRRP